MPESAAKGPAGVKVTEKFDIDVSQVRDYEFRVHFDKPGCPELLVDAPAPLGKDLLPSPSRLLAAAVGHCSASVLLLCARRAGVTLGPIEAKVHTEIVRNERGLPRIGKIEIAIDAHLPEVQDLSVLKDFEALCMVTQSVRDGVEISCKVMGL